LVEAISFSVLSIGIKKKPDIAMSGFPIQAAEERPHE